MVFRGEAICFGVIIWRGVRQKFILRSISLFAGNLLLGTKIDLADIDCVHVCDATVK